jgi:hypothetical protein
MSWRGDGVSAGGDGVSAGGDGVSAGAGGRLGGRIRGLVGFFMWDMNNSTRPPHDVKC